ncbi:MAG: Zn-dependent hydrolase [Gemmatimonadetes bacterium]|nr:Zn-dependent hydrolase [Gemmatimonadota bacterium]MBI3504585.1 Zn-dependent hydrolase [Pseudomonadota bacterium]
MHRRDLVRLAATAAATSILPRIARAKAWSSAVPKIDAARLDSHLRELAVFGRNPQGGVTRLAYSRADLDARAYASGLMRQAGLSVRVDAAGNIIGRRAGKDVSAPPLLFGSHIDSVPEGGNFDGPVGSLGAIEVAQTLTEAGLVTDHPLDVVIWQNEEGGTWGSHLVTSDPTDQELATVANSGHTLREGIALLGGDPARLSSARLRRGDVHAYLELHIEQGGLLDKAQREIGIVEGIVGLREWNVTVEGMANHAGTTPMPDRHDAMLAAARFTEMVNRVVTEEAGRQVGTVGKMQAFPGAPNVVPGRVLCTLELRDLDDAKIQRLFDEVRAEAGKIGALNGTSFSFQEFVTHEGARCDPKIRGLIGDAAARLGYSTMSLPSGAGHDAQNLARVCPMGMIFVPSVAGISHAPKEYSTPEAVARGAQLLLASVLAVDTMPR